MRLSRNCWGDKDVVVFVQRLFCPMCHTSEHMRRRVDVNSPELFCQCPEMARQEAAVGVGVLQ